jgi:hypothetical protein
LKARLALFDGAYAALLPHFGARQARFGAALSQFGPPRLSCGWAFAGRDARAPGRG